MTNYYDTVRSLTRDPELLAAVDRAEAREQHSAEPQRLEPAPRCICGHSLGKHTCGDGPVPCKRTNCDCTMFRLDRPVMSVDIERDRIDGGFVASAPRAPGCVSQGDTITEALTNFADAFTDWAIARALRGMEVPR